MIVVYDTLTGQGMRFAEKLGYAIADVNLGLPNSDEPIFLITRSFNFGEVPETTLDFVEQYRDRIIGVAVSGNRNWGTNFGAAGDKIQAQYQIPLIAKFEGSGFKKDVDDVRTWLEHQEKERAQ